MAEGEFPLQNAAASAACLMGALSEGLIGPLAPEAGDLPNTRTLVDAITTFCLQAVSARPFAAPSPSSDGDTDMTMTIAASPWQDLFQRLLGEPDHRAERRLAGRSSAA